MYTDKRYTLNVVGSRRRRGVVSGQNGRRLHGCLCLSKVTDEARVRNAPTTDRPDPMERPEEESGAGGSGSESGSGSASANANANPNPAVIPIASGSSNVSGGSAGSDAPAVPAVPAAPTSPASATTVTAPSSSPGNFSPLPRRSPPLPGPTCISNLNVTFPLYPLPRNMRADSCTFQKSRTETVRQLVKSKPQPSTTPTPTLTAKVGRPEEEEPEPELDP